MLNSETEAPRADRRKHSAPPADAEALRKAMLAKLNYSVGKDAKTASSRDWFVALALAVRDRIVDRWMSTIRRSHQEKHKQVYYLSVEFLIGRLLMDGLTNLGLTEEAREALAAFGVDLADVRAEEPDAALGNGGLGRLAACFMESMASVGLPAYGYGIRYEHGLFRQMISDGNQLEAPEDWLATGNPWEFERPEIVYPIQFGGFVEQVVGDSETAPLKTIWHPRETVNAVAYDTPVIGWRGKHCNTLRLWSARAVDPIELTAFNRGDHIGSFTARAHAESISRVLYPSDETPAGQALRLRQEYFFTSASLQDLIRRHLTMHPTVKNLADCASIHMNDTHPAIAVAELMRILVDEHEVDWKQAWTITQSTLNYTNHTLLPEALEAWPMGLMTDLLPRHMQIIFLINHRHLKKLPADMQDRQHVVSIIEEGDHKRVRMGNLAFIGSRHINGVSALHTDLMKQTIFADLNTMYPDRIVNKTNGITFRRWLMEANPGLTSLLVDTLGDKVLDDPNHLKGLLPYVGDKAFDERMRRVRRRNKEALAKVIEERVGVRVSPDALFDVQIKRIHEYKRQLLNILSAVAMYREIKANPGIKFPPRVKIFAGKAAASYHRAKLIIKLANDVAKVVNNDPQVSDQLKVVFLPNYNVSLAEVIIPAADLSEQISTAGMEASGTGNMKMALNGALTIGTMDGANIEISEAVGLDNIFIFGMTTPEVEQKRSEGFRGRDALINSYRLKDTLDAIYDGLFSPDDRSRYHSLVDAVLGYDTFMVAADFEAYLRGQRDVDTKWSDQAAWAKARTTNIAGMGWFSSDRTIREYADEIWQVHTS